MIKSPYSPLPYKITPVSPYKILLENHDCVVADIITDLTEYKPEHGRMDAEYIKEACNKYPEVVGFLEHLEATCGHEQTSKKIREYLIDEGYWSNP